MTEPTEAGQDARPFDWPYDPEELRGWTDFNIDQERDYFTARVALGAADWWDRQAARNVRAELEARAQCN